MKRPRLTVALGTLLGGAALAQTMQVSVQPVKGGVILDAGSGPRRFVCDGNTVTHQLMVSGRMLMTKGKFLTVSFDLIDNHLSMEAHDQVRPLESNQVRLTCVKNAIQTQIGHDVEVSEKQ